ncbi:hypothetical protein ACFVIM_02085 [Streptomyces sp. NPDC057638]|uniref:hypothetical protein n=1 Tax=Streptomyces sp. NPDC057638 TaxID=3346190 RepID=UPI0036ADAC85
MGSLRNPIGPLPSTIYWRRRAVVFSVVALLAVLAIWAVSSSGGGGGKDDGGNGDSAAAPSTITPGPSRSGTAIDERPGGREESAPAGGGGSGGDSGPSTSPGGGSGSGPGSGTGGSGGGGSAGAEGGGSGGGTGSGGGALVPGERLSAGSALPNCPPGALKVTLSTDVAYEPDEKPTFRFTVANSSGTTCKADFGPRAAVLTVTLTNEGADRVWSSKDCPSAPGSVLLKVPAGATITHTVHWNRSQTEPGCATPSARAATAGNYLVEARFSGATVAPQPFRLERD